MHAMTVDLCIGVREGCPITYIVTADHQAEFSFGGPRDGCHYAFDKEALTNFLAIGAKALAELEAAHPATSA